MLEMLQGLYSIYVTKTAQDESLHDVSNNNHFVTGTLARIGSDTPGPGRYHCHTSAPRWLGFGRTSLGRVGMTHLLQAGLELVGHSRAGMV